MAQPSIHIFSKSAYSTHTLITLPAQPAHELAPSSLRIRSRILGLTTNNLTYARLGHILGWWDVYPLPPSTPAPYNDPEKYARIAAWGHAEVLDSTVPDIPAGSSVYGYLPIGTLSEDVTIAKTGLKGQVVVTSPHRQHLWKIYNRLTVSPPLGDLMEKKGLDLLGWDALMQPLFGTAYTLNRYGLAWADELRTHPSGQGSWSAEDANIDDAIIVVLSASGKTALSFAHQIRTGRPKEHQPRKIIGVCSEASRSMTEKSGLYDEVVLYTEAEALKEKLEGEQKPAPRIVALDFGARSGARSSFQAALSSLPSPTKFTLIDIGGETKVMTPDETSAQLASFSRNIMVNANELRERGIEVGGDAYFEEFDKSWRQFAGESGIPSMQLEWGEGMEAWKDGWEGLCKDKITADKGLVYRI